MWVRGRHTTGLDLVRRDNTAKTISYHNVLITYINVHTLDGASDFYWREVMERLVNRVITAQIGDYMRTFIPPNGRVQFAIPCQLGQIDTLPRNIRNVYVKNQNVFAEILTNSFNASPFCLWWPVPIILNPGKPPPPPPEGGLSAYPRVFAGFKSLGAIRWRGVPLRRVGRRATLRSFNAVYMNVQGWAEVLCTHF